MQIVVEGLDASGKESICALLQTRFMLDGQDARIQHFPVYNSTSSALIKQYVNYSFA